MENFDIGQFLQVALVISAGVFILGIILRLIMGKGTDLNKSVGAAFGILVIYVVSILLAIENHYEVFMNPLPFISLSGDCLSVFNLMGAGADAVCAELVKMIILSFCVGLIQDLLPEGKSFFGWYFLRCIVVVGAMAVHWGVNIALSTYAPNLLAYANVVLLVLAIALLATTAFKWIIGGILGLAVHPIIGGIYGFMADTIVGKRLLQAILTTIIMTLLVYFLNVNGYTEILLASSALAIFLPALLIIVVVWYLVFKFL